MFCFRNVTKILLLSLLCCLPLCFGNVEYVGATLPRVSEKVIADSEEPFSRRIYSYDVQVDSFGDIHIIYSKPSSGRKANIYYVRRIGGTWQPQILVSSNGFFDNKCTYLLVGSDNILHVSYIKDEGSSEGMYYRTINNGIIGPERFVYGGGWWGRMQLGGNGYPVFVRGGTEWPDVTSRMVMHTTTDGATWDTTYLDLPPATKYQICDFIISDGTYHISYGDSQHKKFVWSNKAMTEKVWDVFHDLHYVSSNDGTNWTHHLIDNSQTLRNIEFWTKMVLDEGRPLIAMYKYAEYGNKFNRGTSARLSEWTGSNWKHKIITNQIYPDTSEGMGVGLAVVAPGDYFGAWDFSPSYPQILPGSSRGNTAMRRSGAKDDWSNVSQLDPFSLEGKARLRARDGKLYFLALGDYTDTKLYFREFSISVLETFLPSQSSFVGEGVNPALSVVLNLLLLGDK